MSNELFPHQKEAILALNMTYDDANISKAGLLVIPTGGGKTFTVVNWIKEKVDELNCRVLWLAQSIELLNQAKLLMDEMFSNRKIKVISSSSTHASIKSLDKDDQICIISSYTAVKNLKVEDSTLKSYFNANSEELFLVVVDEAHHSPAKGNRFLLNFMKKQLKKIWILGLTATPTYTDRNSRGWLWELYDSGIIYEVGKKILQRQKILADEKYIVKRTPMKIFISDEDFNKMVSYNRDIPEKIIEELAENRNRNNFIINEWINNKKVYKKTIIFLDRWYQCLYFKEKLLENGVSVDAVFCQQDEKVNKSIIEKFRSGNIDVLLNVKMLTEGVDIPDVNTVFITRQTTSYILLQQMIGRALRGEKAGGNKQYANIVLFGDRWNRSIAWAKPNKNGGKEEKIKVLSKPLNRISHMIIQEFISKIPFERKKNINLDELLPIGWYEFEFVSYQDESEIIVNRDTVIVYEKDWKLWNDFLEDITENVGEKWENVDFRRIDIEDDLMKFSRKLENVVDGGRDKVIGIVRAVAQESYPIYHKLNFRDCVSFEEITKLIGECDKEHVKKLCHSIYFKKGSIWRILFSTYEQFINIVNILLGEKGYAEVDKFDIDNSIAYADRKEIEKNVKERDGKRCVCCGISGSTVPMKVVDIFDLGNMDINENNMQTLCSRCKNIKKNYNFLIEDRLIDEKKVFCGIPLDNKYFKDTERIRTNVQASINISFGFHACNNVMISRRKNSKKVPYDSCIIEVSNKKNVKRLKKFNMCILEYLQKNLGQNHIKKIVII